MKLVEVRWDDSYGIGGWQDNRDLRHFVRQSHLIRTVGYVIHKSKKKIVVAANISIHSGSSCGHLMAIPMSQVRRIRRLK